jgi:hypothetical protein
MHFAQLLHPKMECNLLHPNKDKNFEYEVRNLFFIWNFFIDIAKQL